MASAAAAVVVDGQFCAPHATAFTVTQKLTWTGTGRDYIVTDGAGGAPVMRVEAARFSYLLRSLLVLDAAPRRPVLTVEEPAFRMGRRWKAFRGDSTSRRSRLFIAVNKTSFFQFNRTKVHVFLAGYDSRERAPDFVVHGSYYGREMTVSRGRDSDAAIAQIGRERTAWCALAGRHTYTARINPGIDHAFILALTVILDEMHSYSLQDHSRRSVRTQNCRHFNKKYHGNTSQR